MAHAMVGTEDSIPALSEPPPELVRDGYLREISRACLGLVGLRGGALVFGPLVLLQFGEPRWIGECWSWSIEGGLLARRGTGRLLAGWRDGRLLSAVVGYSPRLPLWLYRLTQLPFHRWVTRRALKRLARVQPDHQRR